MRNGRLAYRSARRRPFDPRTLGGCVGWFCADRIGDLLADTAAVSTWRDLAIGADLTQTGTNRPTLLLNQQNGLPAVHFLNGSSRWMSTSAAGLGDAVSGSDLPWTIAFTAKINTLANAWIAGWADAANANTSLVVGYTATQWRVQKIDDTATTLTASATTSDTAWHVITANSNGTTVTMRVDGVNKITSGNIDVGTMTATRFAIGAKATSTPNLFVTADIGEVIVYNRQLPGTPAHIQQIEQYLSRRWGIPVA